MKLDRRQFTHALTASGLWLATGCKRRDATPPEVWDDAPAPGRAEALANLAPPWQTPSRSTLANDLLTLWLTEPGEDAIASAPAAHVRLMLPTAQATPLHAGIVAVLSEHLRYRLEARGRARGQTVDLDHHPGRVEVSVHGSAASLPAIIDNLRMALDDRRLGPGLLAARTRIQKLSKASTQADAAFANLAAGLLGVPTVSQHATPDQLAALTQDELESGWQALANPRTAVLVVHCGHGGPEQANTALTRWGETWRARGRWAPKSIIARLRAPPPSTLGNPGGHHLTGKTAAPLQIVKGVPRGAKAHLALGRTLGTASPKARAMARLAQRLAQEQLDARVSLAGSQALFVVSLNLSSTRADTDIEDTIEKLAELGATRQPQQRLFQAAQLWLGARVVQASLLGEDWTALFSEAIDLSEHDKQIPGALAADATEMLAIKSDELHEWFRKWLDPGSGTPGWAWSVSGADDKLLRRLERVATVKRD